MEQISTRELVAWVVALERRGYFGYLKDTNPELLKKNLKASRWKTCQQSLETKRAVAQTLPKIKTRVRVMLSRSKPLQKHSSLSAPH